MYTATRALQMAADEFKAFIAVSTGRKGLKLSYGTVNIYICIGHVKTRLPDRGRNIRLSDAKSRET